MMNWLLDQCFPAETHVLAVIRARVREVCQQVGGGDAWEDAVVLAVNEACMNVIQHGYGPACGFANARLYAGFPHLYWAGTPLPKRFAAAAEQYIKETS